MGQKLVTGVDERLWYVTSTILWSDRSERFEHEKEGGRNAAIFVISLLGMLAFALIAWAVSVPTVIVPPWMFVVIAVVVLFFPGRWALRRRWLLRVEGGRWPNDDDDTPGEAWSGFVRGWSESRAEFKRIVKNLRDRGTPARANSPLQPE